VVCQKFFTLYRRRCRRGLLASYPYIQSSLSVAKLHRGRQSSIGNVADAATLLHISQIKSTPSSTPTTSSLSLLRRQSPIILPCKFVVKRLYPLRLLALAQPIRRGHFEERRSRLHQPFRLNCRHIVHILLRCQNDLLVDNMLNRFSKQCRARME
jgi:hypothetical protein